ncbi:hypothetical protein [Pseudomonas izuensis]|uniref:hypothetical protein n=1 Tax=Pseudomonas izuensis TaxID=2684212 RepID=UPI001FE3C6F5|nr:hypothetical protein [Pseudomonas izuensis]
MRLIRNVDKGFEQTESPSTAARWVNDALMRGRHNIEGLANLGNPSRISSDFEIVEAVRKGDLLLVKERLASSGGGFIARSAPAPTPEPVYIPPKDPWPQAKPRDDQIFVERR